MNATQTAPTGFSGEGIPSELSDLLNKVRSLSPEVARELAPAVAEAIEQARFRSRALGIAKEALERLRLDLELTRFDLEMTRIERDGRRVAS